MKKWMRGVVWVGLVFLCPGARSSAATMAIPAPDLEMFLGYPDQTLLGIGNGPVVEGSAMQRTFIVQAGDALTFNYNFLTSEPLGGLGGVNDFAFVSLVGNDVTVLADSFAGLDPMPGPYQNASGYRTWTTVFTESREVTLQLGIVDTVDGTADSALFVDNITVGGQLLSNSGFEAATLDGFTAAGNVQVVGEMFGISPTEGNFQALLTTVPEPSSVILMGVSAAGCFLLRRRVLK